MYAYIAYNVCMNVIVDGKPVGYDKTGKGKVVLLLHGWGADRTSLASMVKSLASSYTVIAVDVPGFGESTRPDSAWGLAEYAEWLRAFMGKIGVKDIYALVGHSNGGAIAIKAVSSGTVTTKKLVLIGASGVRNREKGKKLFLASVAKSGRVATAILPKKVKKGIRTRWYRRIGSELYDRPGMEDSFKKVVAEDLLIDAAMIDAPTLLLYGSEDRATPPMYGKMYQQVIDGSSMHIIDGAGHYSFVDDPKTVNSYIQDFLKA